MIECSEFSFVALTKDISSIIRHGRTVFLKGLFGKLSIIGRLGGSMNRKSVLIIGELKVLFVFSFLVGLFAGLRKGLTKRTVE